MFDADGHTLGHADDTVDPQVTYCTTGPKLLRYEVLLQYAICARSYTWIGASGRGGRILPGGRRYHPP